MQEIDSNTWKKLSTDEKDCIMRDLSNSLLARGFLYQGLQIFQRFDLTYETGVLTYKATDKERVKDTESEFIFIPGKEVTLGWESWEHGMDAPTGEDLLDSLGEFGIEDMNQFLREQMSPVRQCTIGSLLVESKPRSVGWQEVPLQHIAMLEDAEIAQQLEEFRASAYSQYERHQYFRFVRTEDDILLYMFNEDLSYEQAMATLLNEGFSPPTEDEWEYIYGGGCRTLFPWGDSFNYNMKLKHFEELNEGNDSKDYDLEQRNAFGVMFAGDPYQYEWTTTTRNGELMPKGGDGGSMICGGSGLILGYLPATAVYYRDRYSHELDWEDIMDCLQYRRIVRL
jgi:hypothetical protein